MNKSPLTTIVLFCILVNSCLAAHDAKKALEAANRQLEIMKTIAREVLPSDRLSKPGE